MRYRIKYHDVEKVAENVLENYSGKVERTRITGFFLFFHRKMMDIIGYLDEQTFPSAGNESDWLIRGMLKDYYPVWIRYAYVHHFGQASYVKAIGKEEKMERWKAADDNLVRKHGIHLFDMIQKKLWKDQMFDYMEN
jgi:hypothetical protein